LLWKKKKSAVSPYAFGHDEEVSLDASTTTIFTIKNLVLQEKLGEGNFGAVYKAEWKGTIVAAKKLLDKAGLDEFMKETEVLSKLIHPHIVQFFGIYTDRENFQYMITEFLTLGDLLHYIRNKEDLEVSVLVDMARQAAEGMAYLAEKKIVHRDLALRNLLIRDSNQKVIVKVSDFGLSRFIKEGSEYYKTSSESKLPVKWTAPEGLQFAKFTNKSDVWSYGICVWELFSKGSVPYAGMTNTESTQKIFQGYRLPKPDSCPEEVFNLVLRCWSMNAAERPTFDEIVQKLMAFNEPQPIPVITAKDLNNSKNDSFYEGAYDKI